MFSLKKNQLLVSIGIYIQEMHVIFNGVNVNGKDTGETERRDVPKISNWSLK